MRLIVMIARVANRLRVDRGALPANSGERPGGRASGTRGESRGGRPFEKKPHQGRSSEDGPSGGRPAGAGGKPFGKPGDRPFGRAGGKPAGKPFGKPGGKPKGRPSGPSGRGPGRGPNKSPRS